MSKPKSRPALPVVMVILREGLPSPMQQAGWRQLWAKLLATNDEVAPVGSNVNIPVTRYLFKPSRRPCARSVKRQAGDKAYR